MLIDSPQKTLKIILILILSIYSSYSFAEIRELQLSSKRSVAADYPCNPEIRSATNTSISVNSLQCELNDSNSYCKFIITESNMDMGMFSKFGMRWIDTVHNIYAKQLGVYKTDIYKKFKTKLGDTIEFEMYGQQQNIKMQIKGFWAVDGDRLLRITTLCTPLGTNYLQTQRNIFLSTFMIVK